MGSLTKKRRISALVSICALGLLAGKSFAQTTNTETRPYLAPRAEQILRSACQYLAEAPYFTLSAEIWRERVTERGEKLQFTRELTMAVKRPDRLHAEIKSTYTDRGFWYDGKALSILDRKANVFSSAPMPNTVDAMLDTAHDDFGIDLPLIDLAVSDPYKNATARAQTGRYYGLSRVLGWECHHLGFTQDNIDWQVWIQDGPRPLIRKFVITHKNEDGSPEFTALINDWVFSERISDAEFVFVAPSGATRVEMRKAATNAPRATATHAPAPTESAKP